MNAHRLRRRFEAQGLWVTERGIRPGVPYPTAVVGYDVLLIAANGLLKVTLGNDSVSLAAGDALFLPSGFQVVLEARDAAPAGVQFAAFLPEGPFRSTAVWPETPQPGWPLASVA